MKWMIASDIHGSEYYCRKMLEAFYDEKADRLLLLGDEENLPPLQEGDILLHGHTHVPKRVKHKTYVYLNPGSVSIPKENSYHGYLLLENGAFIWKDFDGTVRDTCQIAE